MSRIAEPVVDAPPPGVVLSPAFGLPLSSYLSEAGRRAAMDAMSPPTWMPRDATIEDMRAAFDGHVFAPKLERARALYPVDVEERVIGGVRTDVVTPVGGCLAANASRVLLNIHGGGFKFGAGLGGLVESVPLASIMGITVVSVDYRLAPEHAHPAAVDDVEAVYEALLEQYSAGNIGLYGCSAGGVLAALVTARLKAGGRALPAALGLLCAGLEAGFGGGDSIYSSFSMRGAPPPPASPNPPATLIPVVYLAGTAVDDASAAVLSVEALTDFPPSLFLTSSRDFELSAATFGHRRMLAAGVDARLVVWDGLAHGFVYDVGIPEVTEALGLLARFFDQKLGRS